MKQNKNEILYLELKDNKGKVIARHGEPSQFPEKFSEQPNENFTEKGFRNIYREKPKGTLHLIVHFDNEYFQGTKSIMRACEIYFSLIPKFKQIESSQRQSFDAITRRFSHNLINFQKRFKDNFDRLISDKSVARPYKDFKDEVERRIMGNTSDAANDICQMSHRARDLDAQIETLRIISGYADNTGSFLSTDIKKALYRLTNPFVDELIKRDITIDIQISNNEAARNKIKLVHSFFNASIWHLFDNANKYALSGSTIVVTVDFNSTPKKLFIKMISITIEKYEENTIFLENRQGKNVKKLDDSGIAQDGVGIGLFIVRKALSLMKASIFVERGEFVKEEGGYPYNKNSFIISFNK